MNRTKLSRHLAVLLTALLMLAGFPTYAQEAEPTDRPFPAQSQPVVPTDRPFPVRSTPIATTEPTVAPASPENAAPTPAAVEDTLTIDAALATAAAAELAVTNLQADVERLTAELESSTADNGATTFALVIIAVGMLLALAVFFGLRRSAE